MISFNSKQPRLMLCYSCKNIKMSLEILMVKYYWHFELLKYLKFLNSNLWYLYCLIREASFCSGGFSNTGHLCPAKLYYHCKYLQLLSGVFNSSLLILWLSENCTKQFNEEKCCGKQWIYPMILVYFSKVDRCLLHISRKFRINKKLMLMTTFCYFWSQNVLSIHQYPSHQQHSNRQGMFDQLFQS